MTGVGPQPGNLTGRAVRGYDWSFTATRTDHAGAAEDWPNDLRLVISPSTAAGHDDEIVTVVSPVGNVATCRVPHAVFDELDWPTAWWWLDDDTDGVLFNAARLDILDVGVSGVGSLAADGVTIAVGSSAVSLTVVGGSTTSPSTDTASWPSLWALGALTGVRLVTDEVVEMHDHDDRYAVNSSYGDVSGSLVEAGGNRYWMSMHGGNYQSATASAKPRVTRALLPADGTWDITADVDFAVVQDAPSEVWPGEATVWAGGDRWLKASDSNMAIVPIQIEYDPSPDSVGHYRLGLGYTPDITAETLEVFWLGHIFRSEFDGPGEAPQVPGPYVISQDGLWMEMYGCDTTAAGDTYTLTRHRLNIADAFAWAEAHNAGTTETPIVSQKWSGGAWVADSGLADDVVGDELLGGANQPTYLHFFDIARVPALGAGVLVIVAPFDDYEGDPFDTDDITLGTSDWSHIALWSDDDGVTWSADPQQILAPALFPHNQSVKYTALASGNNRSLDTPDVTIIATKQPATGNTWSANTSIIRMVARPAVVPEPATTAADLGLGTAAFLSTGVSPGQIAVIPDPVEPRIIPAFIAIATEIGEAGFDTAFSDSGFGTQAPDSIYLIFGQADTAHNGLWTTDGAGDYLTDRVDIFGDDNYIGAIFTAALAVFAGGAEMHAAYAWIMSTSNELVRVGGPLDVAGATSAPASVALVEALEARVEALEP